MEQEEYETILRYLKDKRYPEDVSENEKRRIRSRKDNFCVRIHDGLDYLYTKEGLAVVTKQKKNSVLEMCHVHSGSHLGRDKTFQKLKERYYWKGMYKDTSDYVKRCRECQLTNKKTETLVSEMIPVPVEPRIWSKIGIDLIGPIDKERGIPLSDKGFRYILTVIDYFTKWTEAFPLFSKNTEEIADKLHSLICRFGVMSTIISDQGGEFNSKLIDNLSKKFNINHITTSPYHPQSNGMVEKFNSTLKSMLNKTIKENKNKWEEYLDIALFSYRTSEHHSTKVTPFYALYLRKPILPNEENIAPRPAVEDVELDKVIEGLHETRAEIDKKIMKNIDVAQSRQKKAYDQRHRVDTKGFSEGDKVLLKNFRRKKGLCEQTKYTGPYLIYCYCGKGNYKLSDMNGEKVIGPYNQKSMKRYFETENEEMSEKDDGDYTNIVTDVNNNDTSATETGNETDMEVFDDYQFVTQNTFIEPDENECQSPTVTFNTNFDIELDEMLAPVTRPKRTKKIRQSSIYDYF